MGCRSAKPIMAEAPTMEEIQSAKKGEFKYYSKYETKPDGESYAYTDRTANRPVVLAEAGFAKSFTPSTLPEILKNRLASAGKEPLLRIEDVPEKIKSKDEAPASLAVEQWMTWTYQQFYDESCAAANGFIRLGMGRFDAVTIYGFNHPVWHMSAIGAILGGGVCAGIYPTDTADQVKFKTHHSGAVIAVVQNTDKMKLFLDMAKELPKLKAVVVWNTEAGFEHQTHPVDAPTESRGCMANIGTGGRTIECMSWEYLKSTYGAPITDSDDNLEARMAAQQPGECCAYIYTSGTTGDPKAVMITHDNILFEAKNAVDLINESRGGTEMLRAGDRILSYLPLSHVAGMMVDIICAQVMEKPTTIYFARPYDLKFSTIGERLKVVKPTVFLGVPRVWEKLAEAIVAKRNAEPPSCCAQNLVVGPGKAKNLDHQRNCQLGGSGAYGCCFGIADAVSSKVAGALGLDECTFAFTGAAPIKVETLEFFGALGININEVYGMSECTGATTWSTDGAHRWGSCGWPLPGEEVTIRSTPVVETDRAEPGDELPPGEEGEVCFRGRHIMLGYMGNPDLGPEHVADIAKKNAKTIDAEGWLHSGDKGSMDALGMVKITGRYKELIIGAGGENVAPVPVEDGVKARCDAVANVMMVGDQRKFNVALITLKSVGANLDTPGTDQLEQVVSAIDPATTTVSGAMDSEAIIAAVMKAIVDTNKDPKCCPMPPSTIKKFTILPIDFSVQTDELTPTFKLKRSVVEGKYADAIERLYSEENEKKNYVRYVGPNPHEQPTMAKEVVVAAAMPVVPSSPAAPLPKDEDPSN